MRGGLTGLIEMIFLYAFRPIKFEVPGNYPTLPHFPQLCMHDCILPDQVHPQPPVQPICLEPTTCLHLPHSTLVVILALIAGEVMLVVTSLGHPLLVQADSSMMFAT